MTSYHKNRPDWLSRAIGSSESLAEYVARTERQAGKPIGEITVEEFREMATGTLDAYDSEIAAAAIEHRGVKNMEEVAAVLDPADDDYEQVVAAIRRQAPELLDGRSA